MAESIKYKKPDTYHDAGNVYDNTQQKTQEQINASMIPTDAVSFTEQGYTVIYCKSGNVATVMVYKKSETATNIDITLTQKLPFRSAIDESMAFSSYAGTNNFLQLFADGGIRVVHSAKIGGYKCVATFIAKDI